MVPVPETVPERPSFPNDIRDKDKAKKCLSKWAKYFTEHALHVTRTDLKKIMSILGMMDAYTVTMCPGQCLKCGGKISLTALPEPDGGTRSIQHLDSDGEVTRARSGRCELKDAYSCPLCVNIAFEHSNHCVDMCPLKTDKISALVKHKSTLGFVTSVAATEKNRIANNQKKANQRENQQKRKTREGGGELSSNGSSRPEKFTNKDGRAFVVKPACKAEKHLN